MSEEDEFSEFSGLFKKYLERTDARRSSNTLKNRKVALKQFLDFSGVESVEEIETWHIDDWIDHFLNDGYAPRSVRNKVYVVSGLIEFAINRNEISHNVITKDDLQELTANKIDDHTEVRYIEKEEYHKMIEECEDLRNELVLRLLWNTGVREEEAINIKIDDFDHDDRSITIENAKTHKLDSKEERKVYYGRQLDLVLTKWIDRGRREGYFYSGTSEDEGHLLVTNQQASVSKGRINEIVKEKASDAGVQEKLYEDASERDRYRVTTHAFRHSYAVHRVQNGMPLVYLQDLMGHSDIEQTRKYLIFRDDDRKEADKRYRP